MKGTVRAMRVPEEEEEAVVEDLVGVAAEDFVARSEDEEEDSEIVGEEDFVVASGEDAHPSEGEEDQEEVSAEQEEVKAALNSYQQKTSLFHYHQLASSFQHILL